MIRAYCDQPHPAADAEADRWCEMYHRPVTPRVAYDVVCFDGAVRNRNPFATAAEAAEWAEWGHFCRTDHTVRPVPAPVDPRAAAA